MATTFADVYRTALNGEADAAFAVACLRYTAGSLRANGWTEAQFLDLAHEAFVAESSPADAEMDE